MRRDEKQELVECGTDSEETDSETHLSCCRASSSTETIKTCNQTEERTAVTPNTGRHEHEPQSDGSSSDRRPLPAVGSHRLAA
ncbi:hypothetical protein VZT92_003363 [Zoarces viviparus]|uniref:Uncharacterized protein n=1 Tax=Zoarces viviparus TaxID=48416 RepID=A0AAW1G0Y4_ZOAVI